MRVTFLFNHCFTKELHDYEAGLVPAHRLFGVIGLRELGHDVRLVEPAKNRILGRPRLWRVWQALRAVHGSDAVVATHEAAAMPFLILRFLRITRVPILVQTVALLRPENLGARRRFWSILLREATVLVYASDQVAGVQGSFGVEAVFVPFGVDTTFFQPEDGDGHGASGLSVGTNEGKDYPTLLAALEAEPWTIVTDHANAALIGRHAHVTTLTDVPIISLRELYRAAPVHVIPLHDAPFSSGQTVLLEQLALGRPVVVTDVPGVRDYTTRGVVLAPPRDAAALRAALAAARAMGHNEQGRQQALQFSHEVHARRLEELLMLERRPGTRLLSWRGRRSTHFGMVR